MGSIEKKRDAEPAPVGVESTPRSPEKPGGGESGLQPDGNVETAPAANETVRDEVSGEGGDFFALNEERLGFKSKLNLAIRSALVRLERTVSKEASTTIDGLRREFLSLNIASSPKAIHMGIPLERIIRDYRTFLILRIVASKRQRRRL